MRTLTDSGKGDLQFLVDGQFVPFSTFHHKVENPIPAVFVKIPDL
jgi:hypothetical protein